LPLAFPLYGPSTSLPPLSAQVNVPSAPNTLGQDNALLYSLPGATNAMHYSHEATEPKITSTHLTASTSRGL
jgi:hypothetical protein